MEPGKYIGTVEDYGIKKSAAKGTPGLNIKFNIKESGLSVFWEQWLTPNTVERVIDNLVECELLQTKKFSDVAEGVQGRALSTSQEVELVVINESYTTESGEEKIATKVQYVNPIGGSKGGMKGALDKAEAMTVLGDLNVDAQILASSTKLNIEVQEKAAEEVAAGDIPF